MFKNKDQFNGKYKIKDAEKKITGKMIAKDILLCALPFIVVEVLKNASDGNYFDFELPHNKEYTIKELKEDFPIEQWRI